MIYVFFILGFIFSAILAYVDYHEGIKASKWFYPLGFALTGVTTYAWLAMCKATPDPSLLTLRYVYWDAMLTIIYLGLPLAMFGTRFTSMQWAGIALMTAGTILTRL